MEYVLDVLIVDDNAMNRKVLSHQLKGIVLSSDGDTMRFSCSDADGGLSCLALCKEKDYDLIFMDHMMPDLDGVETCKQLKADSFRDGVYQDIPVIALTANVPDDGGIFYRENGFCEYLAKPIMPDHLKRFLVSLFVEDDAQDDYQNDYQNVDNHAERNAENHIENHVENHVEVNPKSKPLVIPSFDGYDWYIGRLHFMDDDSCLQSLMDFYYMGEAEHDTLKSFYDRMVLSPDDAEILDEYRIKIHSMKSSAMMVGSFALCGLAWMLEKAAKESHVELILHLTPDFLKEWSLFVTEIEEYLKEQELIRSVSEISESSDADFDKESFFVLLQQLSDAAQMLDMDVMDQKMEEILGFQDIIPQHTAELFRLKSAVTELADDKVQEICKHLRDLLEK